VIPIKGLKHPPPDPPSLLGAPYPPFPPPIKHKKRGGDIGHEFSRKFQDIRTKTQFWATTLFHKNFSRKFSVSN
tara:strand:- start:210 stop:431 length:222 start_codon:yes stop_codon:yes gene_type:complete